MTPRFGDFQREDGSTIETLNWQIETLPPWKIAGGNVA
jgi:hypothetical protein